ncbi:Plasmid pRiA4b ORF-3-like protein [Mucisphaera calidilacus]|uniref:Plasmid pRiA4b ORF-3-like protein n=1 Tax=Mucisphaera calidilacus TaxID=2527982 RepID=A0A518BU22_9BACT|nr:Plasmid pRiA4b ORF-3-like protein [Mucisphaera calidilacus]
MKRIVCASGRTRRLRVAPLPPDFGDPTEMEGEDEDVITLAEVCPKVKSKLTYEYDFGDGWEHTIEVQDIAPADPSLASTIRSAWRGNWPVRLKIAAVSIGMNTCSPWWLMPITKNTMIWLNG